MDMDIIGSLAEQAKALPLLPGVYIMRDISDNIIYVGKAKALRNRVSSYFRSVESHTEKVYRMVEHVRRFDYIICDSEFEALVLECSLIKKHSPKYNILLKDDKGYHYIRISPPPFSRITPYKNSPGDDAVYLGPYISSFVVSQTLDAVNRVFMLPTCSKKFPQDIGRGRPCLNYHIKLCSGICAGHISEEEYAHSVSQAVEFIRRGSDETLRILNDQMLEASENLEFEKAALLRDRISAIKKITEKQKVVMYHEENADVIAMVQNGRQASAVVLSIRGGDLVNKQDFMISDPGLPPQARREFILGYYSSGRDIPKKILCDVAPEDSELIARYLSELSSHKVSLAVPVRGDSQELCEMARSNASQRLSKNVERTGRELNALDELAKLFGLDSPPARIEAYDISNYGEQTVIGGMVVFENGRANRKDYRRFSIKGITGIDDYASMKEVLTRRFRRYADGDTDESFSSLPDLLLIDGGRGHLAAALEAISPFGISVPVFGMVKDSKHRTRAIASEGGEISISSHRSAFTLISSIQEEVHRFSVSYSRLKHKKSSFELSIRSIEGVGPKRAAMLFKRFKTVTAIKKASLEELAQCGIGTACARKVFDYFHRD